MAIFTYKDILSITSNLTSDPVLQITNSGEIFYRYNNEMVKVNCPEDITNAFLHTVINFVGSDIDNALTEKYIERLGNIKLSRENLAKIERIIRKNKLENIKNKF